MHTLLTPLFHFACIIGKLKYLGGGREGLEARTVVGGNKEGKTDRFDMKMLRWYINLILGSKNPSQKTFVFQFSFQWSLQINDHYKSNDHYKFTGHNKCMASLKKRWGLTFFFLLQGRLAIIMSIYHESSAT